MKPSSGKTAFAPFVVGALAIACCAIPVLLALGAGTALAALARFWPLTVLGAVLLIAGLARLVGARSSARRLGSSLSARTSVHSANSDSPSAAPSTEWMDEEVTP